MHVESQCIANQPQWLDMGHEQNEKVLGPVSCSHTIHPVCLRCMAVLLWCWFTVDHFVSSDERPKCCVPFTEQCLVGKAHWDQTSDHNFQQLNFFFLKIIHPSLKGPQELNPSPWLNPFILNHRSDLGPPTPCMWASTNFYQIKNSGAS